MSDIQPGVPSPFTEGARIGLASEFPRWTPTRRSIHTPFLIAHDWPSGSIVEALTEAPDDEDA